jgi:hypothetical protein
VYYELRTVDTNLQQTGVALLYLLSHSIRVDESLTICLLALVSLSDFSFSRVELILNALRNLLEEMLWEESQAIPRNIKTLEDVTVLVRSLRQEVILELVEELEVQVILFTERFLADDSLERSDIDRCGVVRIQLIRHVRMINASHALSDTALHQTGQ